MKKTLSLTELEAQTVTALPDREMPLVFINVVLLNGVTVVVPVNAAANICGVTVAALLADAETGDTTCNAQARQG